MELKREMKDAIVKRRIMGECIKEIWQPRAYTKSQKQENNNEYLKTEV